MDFERDNFVGFWSNAEKEKKKGSSVGLLIHKKWERHLGQVKKVSPYFLEATFLFKQLELIIIMVYIPPNNKEITRAVQQSIVKKVAQGSQRNQYIIMGILIMFLIKPWTGNAQGRSKENFPCINGCISKSS